MHPDRQPLEPLPLDWSKLLGFDQFTRAATAGDLHDPACAKVGVKPVPQAPNFAKVGSKQL